MSTTFDESEAEKMVVAACEANGWKYRTQDQYVRPPNSVLVEGVLREVPLPVRGRAGARPSRSAAYFACDVRP